MHRKSPACSENPQLSQKSSQNPGIPNPQINLSKFEYFSLNIIPDIERGSLIPILTLFLLSILSFFKSVKNHEFFLVVCESVEEDNSIYRISDFFPMQDVYLNSELKDFPSIVIEFEISHQKTRHMKRKIKRNLFEYSCWYWIIRSDW